MDAWSDLIKYDFSGPLRLLPATGASRTANVSNARRLKALFLRVTPILGMKFVFNGNIILSNKPAYNNP